MEINNATKLLAYSFVSELIARKKVNKDKAIENAKKSARTKSNSVTYEADFADVNFGELEEYYRKVVAIIEKTPDVRKSVVSKLKALQEQGKDLNDLYPAKLIAEEGSIERLLFLE